MKVNLTGIVWLSLCTCVGYLITNSLHGTIAGLTVGLFITLLAEIFL
jgi:hypothetical protein